MAGRIAKKIAKLTGRRKAAKATRGATAGQARTPRAKRKVGKRVV